MNERKTSSQSRNTGNYSAENRRAAREKRKKAGKLKAKLFLLLIIVIFVFILFQIFFGKNAENVTVSGNVVCTVARSKITAEDIKNTVTASLSKDLSTNIEITDEITLVPVHASKDKQVTVEYAVTKTKEAVKYNVEAGIIIVNNQKAAVLKTKQEADNLLESIKGKYAPENADVTKCTFEQSVSTTTDFVDSSDILSFEEAYKKLTYTTEVDDVYTVVSGDTISKVADKFEMNLNNLKELNSLSGDNLRIGQELKVKKQVPFLTVKYNG